MTDLRRHVPPIALTWDDEVPGALWRVVDGTLVFADISGFTALTEKLSRRGRIGAEEIVETLNRVFGPMLRIAGARGGELLKFGGDALLFLFRGEGHSEQACDAAVEMRVALRQAAAVPTSVGRLSLSMSVGIHSGDVHLFLVGAPTRELLILGPAATQTALAEKAADAGQIVVSAETAGRLPADAIRPREDGELLFRRRSPRTKPGASFVVPEVDRDRLHGLFPHELGRYLDPGAPDPEHRTASIAFIRFSGTDALLAGPGPEALALALDRTVSLVEEALVPEAISLLATDIDSDGGKFFLGAGIPTAFDDNEGRMLRALREIADAGAPLPLQLGVNRGHVFAAEVGIPERAAYTGMGDTTNTAARIMSKAPAGVLYAHPAVLEHSRTLFSVQPAGPFPMKGKAVPLLVFEVGEELGTREEATVASRLPFLGREEEIQTVRQALIDALAGAGGVVVVDGATGMGKSRLVFEAVEAITGAHVLVVRAEPYGAASAYRVFRDPVRRLMALERGTPEAMGLAMMATLSQVAPDLLPLAPLLADVVQVDVPSTPEVDMLDPQFRPDRLADAVVRFVDAALPGPLVLLAEEAHWADGASARLLDQIAAASAGRPWAVVVVRRGQDGGFAPATGTTRDARPAAGARHGAAGHRRHRGHAAAPPRDRRDRRPRAGQPPVRRGGHAGRPDHRLAGHPAGLRPSSHERSDRPASPGRPARPALLRGARPELPRRGAAQDPGRGRAAGRADPRRASRVPRTGRSRALAVPQQPRSRRCLRRAGLPDPQPPASRGRRGAGGDEHRPRRRLADAGAALLAGGRCRADVAVRPAGRRVGARVVRQRRRRPRSSSGRSR